MDKIAAIIVTYNRKEDLINCINSIYSQEKKVDAIYIIDNNSTDGTPDFLVQENIINTLPNSSPNEDIITTYFANIPTDVELIYVKKLNNDGGAGGFYKGMELAYNDGFDWLWLMDDDGVADKRQLLNLYNFAISNNEFYLNALVLDKENRNKLAFGLKGYSNITDIKEMGYIKGFVNPFNGTLISRKVIDKIGFVKKEMFIWGDEKEYTNRVRKNGYNLITVLSALHIHPKDKGVKIKVIPFIAKYKIIIKPTNLAHIYYRNLGYLESVYGNFKVRLVSKIMYSVYFVLRLKFKELSTFHKYYKKGVNNNFN